MTTTADYGVPLNITVRRDGPVHFVSLSGAATMFVAENMESRLLGLIDDSTPNMVIDLSDLTFITSIGIGVLIAADARSQSLRGAARLVNPTGEVARILEMTNIDSLLEIHATLDDAVGSLPDFAR